MMYSIKWIGLASGVALGFYWLSKTLRSNNVETFKHLPPPPPLQQQLTSSLQQQQQPLPSPPSQQQQQLTVPFVENCITIPNKQIKHDGESSMNEKTDVRQPVKRKNKNKKQLLNMFQLIYPKTPLMVFSELYNRVPINLQRHQIHASNVMSYTATIEIDNQMYTGSHISETKAKQKVCENFLRTMLAKQLSKRSAENALISKIKGRPLDDFPWLSVASLAMDYLLSQWKLQLEFTKANYVQEESHSNTREENNNARMSNYVRPKSPVVVFSELYNGKPINFQRHQVDASNVMSYTAIIEINGQMYSENHISKIQAKQKVCEKVLRIMLAKELTGRFAENASISKIKRRPLDDFPWLSFASLAMDYLLNQWELQP